MTEPTVASTTINIAASIPGIGEFGGYPYGLEPLFLPDPDVPNLPDLAGLSAISAAAYRHIETLARQSHSSMPVVTQADPTELFWFRWITGHQVSFLLWRLMACLLKDEAAESQHTEQLIPSLCHYIRGYSAMLIYAGSCPQEIYQRLIRPSMYLQHHSFSGSWAPDYRPVRNLLRGRWAPASDIPALARELQLHRLVHDKVATYLVPYGGSLLQITGQHRQDTQLLHQLYDNYFLTIRASQSREAIVDQLLRRLVAITQDILTNTVHPLESALPEHLSTLCDQRSFLHALAQIAKEACQTSAPKQE